MSHYKRVSMCTCGRDEREISGEEGLSDSS